MENFIQANPGLRSRFSKYIHFEDYTPEESLSIFRGMCGKAGLTPDRDAERAALRHFTARSNRRDENFANARDVRNFFEMAIENQANRLAAMLSIPENEITTLRAEDIDAAARRQGT